MTAALDRRLLLWLTLLILSVAVLLTASCSCKHKPAPPPQPTPASTPSVVPTGAVTPADAHYLLDEQVEHRH